MASDDNTSHDLDLNEQLMQTQEEIIAELCAKAGSIKIRNCLRQYDPRKPTNQLQKIFNSHSNKDVLIETSNYLGISNPELYKKPNLIHNIICRIQNFFPDKCQICGETYCIKIDDSPFLACDLCGQEVHKPCFLSIINNEGDDNEFITKPNINPFNLPGIHYLCGPCESQSIPDKSSGLIKKPPVLSATQSSTSNQQDEYITPYQRNRETESVISSQDAAIQDSGDMLNAPKEIKSPKTCHFFKKGSCKHGINGKDCKFTHPKMCKKFISNGNKGPRGCNLGKGCMYFHPQMCLNSLRNSKCYSDTCNLRHIKGTKRKPPESKDTQQLNSSKSSPNEHPPNISMNTKQSNKDFLDIVHQLKVEILQTVESKLQEVKYQLPMPILQNQKMQPLPNHTTHHQFYPPMNMQLLPALNQQLQPQYYLPNSNLQFNPITGTQA